MKLSSDDIIRRDIIRKIRSYFHLNIVEIEKLYDIEFKEYFELELIKLEQFAEDGLIEMIDNAIVVTETGYQFTNIICRVFDKYYNGDLMAKDLGELTLKGNLLSPTGVVK